MFDKSENDESLGRCAVCHSGFCPAHGGLNDCKRLVEGPQHVRETKRREGCSNISQFFSPEKSNGEGLPPSTTFINIRSAERTTGINLLSLLAWQTSRFITLWSQ
ncbi:hypothetical protein MHYP_G00064400 [Metynnis hypsauchen]